MALLAHAFDVEPVVCTLTTKQAANQLVEWSDLRSSATEIRLLDDGIDMWLPSDLEDVARDLAGREAQCCAFLSIELEPIDAALRLRITTPTIEGRGVIDLLAGVDRG